MNVRNFILYTTTTTIEDDVRALRFHSPARKDRSTSTIQVIKTEASEDRRETMVFRHLLYARRVIIAKRNAAHPRRRLSNYGNLSKNLFANTAACRIPKRRQSQCTSSFAEEKTERKGTVVCGRRASLRQRPNRMFCAKPRTSSHALLAGEGSPGNPDSPTAHCATHEIAASSAIDRHWLRFDCSEKGEVVFCTDVERTGTSTY